MTSAIPFGDWLHEQGNNVFVALADVHPDVLILVDKTDLAVYRYTIDRDVDGLDETMGELMRGYGHTSGKPRWTNELRI